jgi:3-hydroxybutyryl-CoA dehydratase
MTTIPVAIGAEVSFAKTFAESDFYLFAGISGDFDKAHVNEEYMKTTVFGRRIAHGLLVLSLSSTTASLMSSRYSSTESAFTPVSAGYDRVRFIKPVFIGDTISVVYRIAEVDQERSRSRGKLEMTNQHGETVCIAEHIMAWLPRETG